jgi:hypothetical protein|tara:strand:+ start:2411 stop:3064 length:654 start_codon:yes stop_codon:yes gene_type:complete
MSTQYLTIVNEVLRRLREDEVSAVANTTYSKMVGDFVNDAKRIVEDSHAWSTLRTTIVVPTVADTTEYSLTNAGERVKIYSAINDTSNFFMRYESPNWFNNAYYISGEVTGTPDSYTFSGIDSNEDTKVQVYPKPDAVYSMRFDLIAREAELVNDTDTTVLPKNAIIHNAVALLARERGETGGTTAQDYFLIADKHLSDAVAIDAYKNPEEFIYTVP